ncbi:MAG: 50S ribosomal protein L3 [Candidatus Omnitrophica bacterium]|nr:50S ribosomal protein L3 [Candidatus Omnitrophota bacterium]
MINGLLGKKLGMTQIFSVKGEAISVTVVEAGPCVVLQVKTKEKDGYLSAQLGYSEKKESRTNKPDMGRFKKVGVKPTRFVRELRSEDLEGLKIKDSVTVNIFQAGEYVNVTGVSIGKGFQGGIKRWHWKGGPKSHGSKSHRAPGSIGSSADPSRVFKGQHLPGQMGNKKVTVQNLEVVEIDEENNLMLLKGATPGFKGGYLVIKKSIRKKKKEPKPEAEEGKDKKEGTGARKNSSPKKK